MNLACLLLGASLSASTCVTISDGLLSDPAIWDCGCDPTTCDTLDIAHALVLSGGHWFDNANVHIMPGGSLYTADTLRFNGVLMNDGSLTALRIEQWQTSTWFSNTGSVMANRVWLRGDSAYNAGTLLATDTLDVGTDTYMTNHGRMEGGFLWGGTIMNYDTIHFLGSAFDRPLENHLLTWVDGSLFSFLVVENYAGATLRVDTFLVLNSIVNYGVIQAEDLLQFGTPTDDNGYIDFLSSQATISCGNLKNYGTIQGFGDICVQDSSINYGTGVITGSPDICDATLTATSEPYLDLNLGIVGPGVNWCAQTSCITSIPVDAEPVQSLTPSPNPATDRVRIEGLDARPQDIVLLDAQRRTCPVRSSWNSGVLVLERGDLSAGCYTLVISPDESDQRSVARVVFVDP